jgi:hypothetical protein
MLKAKKSSSLIADFKKLKEKRKMFGGTMLFGVQS